MQDNKIKKQKTDPRRKTLSSRAGRFTFMCCAIFWLVAVTIGLTLYGRLLYKQYIMHAFDVADGISLSVRRGVDSVSLAKEIREIYDSLSEEERLQVGTPEYRKHFSGIDMKEGTTYSRLRHMLSEYSRDITDVDLVYLAMIDGERDRLIYIIDSEDISTAYFPGDWEYIKPEFAKKFLSWDGVGQLYYISNYKEYGWICTAGVPVRDENGNTVAFILSDVGIDDIALGIARYAFQITLALLVAAIVISLLIMKRIGRTVVGPINMIASAAERYAKDKKAEHSSSVFSSLNINTGDELENLSRVMADMEKDISEYMEDLTEMTAKEERARAELTMASQIQAASLPDLKDAITDTQRYSLYAEMKPAKTVGGDFYDFFMTDDKHLAFVIADVSDKGIPAALFMMSAKNLINYRAKEGGTPAQILSSVNSHLCRNNRSRMFVTVWLGILDITCGRLLFANAGHEPAAISHAGAGFEFVAGLKKPAIGIISGTDYTDQELMLEPGDKVFLYTDGITEAADGTGTFFGSDRMTDALNALVAGLPTDVIKGVGDSIASFVKDAEQFDDMTMLCLIYKNKGEI